jgi:hypothetical protein
MGRPSFISKARGILKQSWVAGLIGLLGLVIGLVGIVFAVLERQDARDQAIVVGTQIALEEDENGILAQIVTIQAGNIAGGPQATADAERITALIATQKAIQTRQAQAPAISPIDGATPVPSAARTTITSDLPDGVTVELLELYRFQNMITARLRFTNSSENRHVFQSTTNSRLIDEVNGQEYPVGPQSMTGIVLEPSEDVVVSAKYSIETEDTPLYLTLSLPNGVTFDHVEVKIKTQE